MSRSRIDFSSTAYVLDRGHFVVQGLSPLFVLGCWVTMPIGLIALIPYLPFVIMAAGTAHALHGFFRACNKRSGEVEDFESGSPQMLVGLGWDQMDKDKSKLSCFNKSIAGAEILTGSGLFAFGYHSYTQLSALGAYTASTAGSATVFALSVTNLCWAFMVQAWVQWIVDVIALEQNKVHINQTQLAYKQLAKAIMWTVVASKMAAASAAVTATVVTAVATAPITSLLMIGMACLAGIHVVHGLFYCRSNFFSKKVNTQFIQHISASEKPRGDCNLFLAP